MNLPEPLVTLWGWLARLWVEGLWGVHVLGVGLSLVIVLLLLAWRRPLSLPLLALERRIARRLAGDLAEPLTEAAAPAARGAVPLLGLFAVLSWWGVGGSLDGGPLGGLLGDVAMRALATAAVLLLFVALYRMSGVLTPALVARLARHAPLTIARWSGSLLRLVIPLVAAVTALEMWGIAVAPLVAGLGLMGVAVALGAQDLFKNLIAGLIAITERRVTVGDWVLLGNGTEGTVEHVGFRTTRIRRFDKAPVSVPNAQLADNAVINFSGMTGRRIYWHVGLEYRATEAQLRRIRDGVEGLIIGNPNFVQPPEATTIIRLDRFGPSSVDMMLYCFTQTTVWTEWMAIKEQLLLDIKRVVEEAGAGFAFPSQSLYVESLPPEAQSAPAPAPPSPTQHAS